MLTYIQIRRQESANWIKSVCSNCDIHYLNIQDGIGVRDINTLYGAEIFESVNKGSYFEIAQDKLYNIVGEDIILVPNSENHPSHQLSQILCESLPNSKIYYVVHPIFSNKIIAQPGVHYKEIKLSGQKFHNYNYIYSEEELIQKRKEFQIYYTSQYEDFLKTGLNIKNWENYISSVPLKLTDEDKVFKLKDKIKLEHLEGLL